MRLWLKDSERRADPPPVVTDDRKAILVGLAGWVVALISVLAFVFMSGAQIAGFAVWTCVVGIGLGAVGLGYTNHRHRKD